VAQAEFARYQAQRAARSVDTPWVSTVAVWIVGAALTSPPAAVLAVAAVLYAHERFRGPGRRSGRAVAGTVAAMLASVVAPASGDVLAGVSAGLLYLAATDGPALLRGAWRLVTGARPLVSVGDEATCVALGVMVGLLAHFSPLAVLCVLFPVSYLRRSAHGRALRHAAAHDPKTQLWNHAAWQTLSSAALSSHRTRARSAVLMVDLDHFKRFNDTYGHRAGDDVLAAVAHVLRNTTRRNDIVARIGGEEFSVLLPGVTEQEACQAAERIRDQIAALTVITTNLHGHPTAINGITASIGVAATHRPDTSVADLLVNADRWMYQAKESGRNRVCGPLLAAAA
jgi:diguanylate cyclase (GGDEF)-like protein